MNDTTYHERHYIGKFVLLGALYVTIHVRCEKYNIGNAI